MTVQLIALVKPLERNDSYFHLKLISKLTKQDTPRPNTSLEQRDEEPMIFRQVWDRSLIKTVGNKEVCQL